MSLDDFCGRRGARREVASSTVRARADHNLPPLSFPASIRFREWWSTFLCSHRLDADALLLLPQLPLRSSAVSQIPQLSPIYYSRVLPEVYNVSSDVIAVLDMLTPLGRESNVDERARR